MLLRPRGARRSERASHLSLLGEERDETIGCIYTITYEAEDHSGNKTTRIVTVTVPKSQSSP